VEISGVGAGERDYTAQSHSPWDGNAWRVVLNSLAGDLSVCKHAGRGSQLFPDEELLDMLTEMEQFPEEYEPEKGIAWCDESDALKAIKEENPDWTNEAIIGEYKSYRDECWERLQDPTIWGNIEKLANLLLEKGRLEHEEVEEALILCSNHSRGLASARGFP
jgi:hypothetical protein